MFEFDMQLDEENSVSAEDGDTVSPDVSDAAAADADAASAESSEDPTPASPTATAAASEYPDVPVDDVDEIGEIVEEAPPIDEAMEDADVRGIENAANDIVAESVKAASLILLSTPNSGERKTAGATNDKLSDSTALTEALTEEPADTQPTEATAEDVVAAAVEAATIIAESSAAAAEAAEPRLLGDEAEEVEELKQDKESEKYM